MKNRFFSCGKFFALLKHGDSRKEMDFLGNVRGAAPERGRYRPRLLQYWMHDNPCGGELRASLQEVRRESLRVLCISDHSVHACRPYRRSADGHVALIVHKYRCARRLSRSEKGGFNLPEER